MQHLEGSGTPVLYIGRTVLKGQTREQRLVPIHKTTLRHTPEYSYVASQYIISATRFTEHRSIKTVVFRQTFCIYF
jgi:hypothetical protein